MVAGYVLMPEHVHLLVGEPLTSSLSIALQVLKQETSRKLKRNGELRFWQRRYYDFNVHSELKRVEKLRYMHRNPVRRGLVGKPEDWPWSSFVHYATGVIGTVEIESEWTARRREENEMLVSRQSCIPPLRSPRRPQGWGTHGVGKEGKINAVGRPPVCLIQRKGKKMARREPLTPKQTVAFVVTTFVLITPMMLFIIVGRDSISPRQFAAVGLVNLLLMIPLYALITEKWIRKMK